MSIYRIDRIGDVKMTTVRIMLAKAVDKNSDIDASFMILMFQFDRKVG